jgi:hypothetical protein
MVEVGFGLLCCPFESTTCVMFCAVSSAPQQAYSAEKSSSKDRKGLRTINLTQSYPTSLSEATHNKAGAVPETSEMEGKSIIIPHISSLIVHRYSAH